MVELTHISLFTGIGGIDLAAECAGFKTILMVENNTYCQKVLKKHWPDVPIHQDIFDLSIWELGKNDGVCYNKLCEAKSKEKQIQQTYNWLMMPREEGELIKSVSLAAKWCPYLQALLPEVGNTVHGNVVSRQCEEKMEQMPMAGFGCEVPITPTGKMGEDTKDTNDTKKPKSLNGEGEFLQETIIPANSANSNPKDTTIYDHITSTPGQNIPKNDLKYLMELLYAKHATTQCTRRARTTDLLSAGTPCQPASVAGQQRGKEDDRWLWTETYRIIRELQPKWIVLENVKGLLTLGDGVEFDNLLFDLESSYYKTQSFLIPACAVNAPHRRDRVFIVANTRYYVRPDLEITGNNEQAIRNNKEGQEGSIKLTRSSGSEGRNKDVADSQGIGIQGSGAIGEQETRTHEEKELSLCSSPGSRESITHSSKQGLERGTGTELSGKRQGFTGSNRREGKDWWAVEPDVGRVAHGISARVDRLKCLGNAVVPQQIYPILKAIADIEGLK